MNTPALTVDGFDLASHGFTISKIDGHRSAPERALPVSEVAALHLAILLGTDGTVRPRRLAIQGSQSAGSVQALTAALEELQWRLWGKEVALTFSDRPDRFLRARVELLDIPPIAPVLTQRGHQVRLGFICADPRWHALQVTAVAFGGAGVQTPLWNAPVSPEIRITGASSPALVYLDGSGAERGRMDFTGLTIPAGVDLIIDTAAMTLTDSAGTNRADALLGGAFLQALDPRHRVGAAMPRLAVTSGSGTATYRKASL